MVPEQFVRALDAFEAVAGGVPPDAWDAPSPCDGWSVADVVDHVADGLRAIRALTIEGLTRDEGGGAAGDGAVAGDPLTRWRSARVDLLLVLDDAALVRDVNLPWGGQMPLGEYAARYPLELVVHTWDLAQATDQAVAIDPDLAAEALATAVRFAPVARSTGMIGPERAVAEDADDLTRLLAIFGRQAT